MSDIVKKLVACSNNSGMTTVVNSPFDRSPIATVDLAGETTIEFALDTADRLFRNRDQWLPADRRIQILERAAKLMTARREHLAMEAAREGGKPLKDSLVETDRAIDGMKVCVETLRTQCGTEIPMRLNVASNHRYASTYFEPIGPVVAFSAFNHPLNLIVHQVAPAIATGCPVIVKPAEATPLSCFRFVEILREAGLPDSWCQAFITTGHEVSGKLVSDPRVNFFSFIGSNRVGWMLRSQLAPGTRCALEHGGAAPVIVADDANLDEAIPLMAKGGFYHAGQVCVSVQRIFVERKLADELTERLAAAAKKLVVGDPTQEETDVGPLIRPEEVVRTGEWIDEAIAEGAELICGGKSLSETTFAPTVLRNPAPTSKVSTQEIFGPVVCVYEYDKIDDAIEQANSLPFSFQASVFTKDIDTAMRASRRLSAATVMINDHSAFRVDWMPFAGLRDSGLGIGGIPYTMHDMQIEKQVVWKSKEL